MTATCTNCGCQRPGDIVLCRQCRHDACDGCLGLDDLCDLCHDIEKERNG